MHRFGPARAGDGYDFRLWSPGSAIATLHLEGRDPIPMRALPLGHFGVHVKEVEPGARYRFSINDGPAFPDPASMFQPDGVHGASELVDLRDFPWTDAAWEGIPKHKQVFYELHVGTFTPEGTLRSAMDKLPYLKDLGVNTIELMPLADWPGRWGWGYDHAAMWAVSRAYGRPEDLCAFVDAAHALGLAVYTDVIYNHLGPDGSYLAAFAPIFTRRHRTPWGAAINFDDMYCDGTRAFFVRNALLWLETYHLDGIRLDATDQIFDDSREHFLAQLAREVQAIPGRPRYLVAEDHRNLNTIIRPLHEGGYGMDGIWVDDFHHQMRNLLAGDTRGYYAGYAHTTIEQLATTLRNNWFYTGQYQAYWNKQRGSSPEGTAPESVVFYIQNHDQVGNRPHGDRLHHQISEDTYRAATALLLFLPQLPLLFQGQEWAASTPFYFFSDHEPELGKKVTEGRRKDLEHLVGSGAGVPDPQDPATFEASKLRWDERSAPAHARMLAWYKACLAAREDVEGPLQVETNGSEGLVLRRGRHTLAVALGPEQKVALPDGAMVLSSADAAFATSSIPPQTEDGHLYFTTPGAVLFRTDPAV